MICRHAEINVSSVVYVAECPSYPLYQRHPNSTCQYLKCESTGYVNPEGRTRYIVEEHTCPSTRGIPRYFIEGIITPCSKYRDECTPGKLILAQPQ